MRFEHSSHSSFRIFAITLFTSSIMGFQKTVVYIIVCCFRTNEVILCIHSINDKFVVHEKFDILFFATRTTCFKYNTTHCDVYTVHKKYWNYYWSNDTNDFHPQRPRIAAYNSMIHRAYSFSLSDDGLKNKLPTNKINENTQLRSIPQKKQNFL